MSNSQSLIAVDIGNSFLHLGRYSIEESDEFGLPRLLPWGRNLPAQVRKCQVADEQLLREVESAADNWFVVSVHSQRQLQLAQAVRGLDSRAAYRVLTYRDFPLALDVERPERVGTDRIAAAVAAYQLRGHAKSVLVVDAGTAITVDRVDEPGVFRGGAILPGPYLLADALHRHTDALPLIEVPQDPPPPVGKNTEAAIGSGIFWGLVGALRELVARMREELESSPPIFYTGGGAGHMSVAELIGATSASDLVLRGIALAGKRLVTSASSELETPLCDGAQ